VLPRSHLATPLLGYRRSICADARSVSPQIGPAEDDPWPIPSAARRDADDGTDVDDW